MGITAQAIYTAIAELRTEVKDSTNRIEDKLTSHGEKIAKIEEHLRSQNGRIAKVEKTSSWSETKILLGMGGLTALSLIATAKATGLI